MGTTDRTITAVRDALAPVVAGLGLDLYDVELNGTGAARTLRVTVERAGGVDLDAITEVTRAVSPVLDAEPTLAGPYLLEVSSPGLERTLRTPAHFVGARGATVSIKFRTAGGGTARVKGVLVDADDRGVVVEGDDGRHELAYADMTQARTVFEWGPPPRASRKGARVAAGRATGERKGASA
jgi:ribosome maturation factor RimP